MQGNPEYIVDVTAANAQSVLEASMQTPIILQFWADWCQPCKNLMPILEKLVNELNGAVILGKVNADEEQQLSAQFGVRSLPTLKLVHQGQLVSELMGQQTEAALREWLAPVLQNMPPSEEEQEDAFLEKVQAVLEAGDTENAQQVLQQFLQNKPESHKARALLADSFIGDGNIGAAETLLAEVAEDVVELRPYRARLQLLEELAATELPSLAEVKQQLESQKIPENLYSFGLQSAAAGQFQQGLDALIELLRTAPDFQDGAVKAALLKVFDCLPKGDPLASEYRRKMFNYLY